MKYNLEDWLIEYDIPSAASNPDTQMGAGGMPPTSDPYQGSREPNKQNDPNITRENIERRIINTNGVCKLTEF